MELLKSIFTNIDFHLNTKTRTLDIIYGQNQIRLSLDAENNVYLSTNLKLALSTDTTASNQSLLKDLLILKVLFLSQNLSKSSCVANCAYLQSSFLLSAYISLISPIDSISKSAIDKPNCTHLKRNNGVVISRSVGRSFFQPQHRSEH